MHVERRCEETGVRREGGREDGHEEEEAVWKG